MHFGSCKEVKLTLRKFSNWGATLSCHLTAHVLCTLNLHFCVTLTLFMPTYALSFKQTNSLTSIPQLSHTLESKKTVVLTLQMVMTSIPDQKEHHVSFLYLSNCTVY